MDEETLDLGLNLAASSADNAHKTDDASGDYVVLARKYRPKDFTTLIGQDALVQTLKNAFSQRRLAHAFLLTGVRGVGKTTSARILAKAFNCIGPNAERINPSIDPCGICANCKAITEDRHVDVLEIDAASNNGVDYIRELQSELHYKPVQARYRVYIVDEVHMLSTNAFNAFLKTLEEPPGHVKFIFATTEGNKIPTTIRSRCQRFDLRRVSSEQLKEYFGKLAHIEGVNIDDQALALVAQAADGSVRDGLSMLDQAISLSGQNNDGCVTSDIVRNMLNLNDSTSLMALFEYIHSGDIAKALALFEEMFTDGADPSIVTRQLAELTHLVTRRKIIGENVAILKSQQELEFLAKMAAGLSLAHLNRSWTLLIKGLDELRHTMHPQMSFDMLLVRLCHVAKMPDPDSLLKQLNRQDNGGDDAQPTHAVQNTTAKSDIASAGAGAGTEFDSESETKFGQHLEPPMDKVTYEQPSNIQPTPIAPLYNSNDLDSNFLVNENNEAAGNLADFDHSKALKLPEPTSFKELVTMIEETGNGQLSTHLNEDVRLVSFENNVIRIRLTDRAPRDITRTLTATLQKLTGKNWNVGLSDEDGDLPLGKQRRLARADEYKAVAKHPSVARTLAAFPDATIHDIRHKHPDANPITGITNNKTIH